MKIAIDARQCTCNMRGMGYFLKGVLEALAKFDYCNEYILLVNNKSNVRNLNIGQNFKIYESDFPIGIADFFVIPYLINCKIQPDVVWFPANNCSPFISKKIKIISTIYDIMFFTQKAKFFSRQYLGALYRKWFSTIAIKRADRINTETNFNIELISRFFNVTKEKFFYTYAGVDNPGEYDDSILTEIALEKEGYFYSITGVSENKNLSVLLKAYENYCAKYNNSYKLVLTGVSSKYLNTSNPNIIYTGYVSNAQKNTLLQNCKLFLFLSRDEGFGIPPLEALFQQSNVLLTEIPNFKELYEGYVNFTDKDNHKKIAKDVDYAIANPKKIDLQSLKDKFSWDKAAKIFRAEFEKLVV